MAAGLTRRELLKAGAYAAASPLAEPLARLAPPKDGFHAAFFSDTHVSITRNVAECAAMLAEIRSAFAPDFAINGGDVTEYGWEEEYESYRRLVASLPFPIYHNPGNHDVRWSPLGMQVFRRHLDEPFRAVSHKGCLFVVLDSTVPLSHWGHFEAVQLEWLAGVLKNAGRETPVVLATHHWVGRDNPMIDNEGALLKVIQPYNVRLILNGHGHSDLLWNWDGIACTMNKGLYQGSYQRLAFDPSLDRLVLERRTAEKPELSPIWEGRLKADRSRRQVWAPGSPDDVPAGTTLQWNSGPIVPADRDLVSGKGQGLAAGPNTLTLRGPNGSSFLQTVSVIRALEPLLEPLWGTRLTGGVMSHLRLARGMVIVSAMDGSVTALDKNSGQPLWRRQTGGYCHSSPCIAGDKVVVGSADGTVYCWSLHTGKELWRREGGGPVYSGPAFNGKVVCASWGSGELRGLCPETGAELWMSTLPASRTAFVQSAAATDGERFFMGAWDGHLYAFDAKSGAMAWRQPCTSRSFAFSPAIGSPIAARGSVFVTANGNSLLRFASATGEKQWEAVSPGDKYGHSGPAASGERIVAGCLGDKGEVRCVDAATGAELWCCPTGSIIYDSSPALCGRYAAIGSVDSLLNLIEVESGRLAWQQRLEKGHFLSKPAGEPGRVYAATLNGVVSAFGIRP